MSDLNISGNYLKNGTNILNSKQDTLVSGTNIKTVNSTSLLGSGNVAVQPTLVSGTNIKTINGNSVLGSGDLVISGGGGGGIHSFGAFWSTFNYPTSAQVVASGFQNFTCQANQTYWFPYVPSQSYTCGSFMINVQTAQASGLARICVYDNVNGLPGTLLYNSADLDCSTTGDKVATTTFDFVAGTTYWLAFQANIFGISTRGFNGSTMLPLSVWVAAGYSVVCWAKTSTIFANGAPTNLTPNTFNSIAPGIFMFKK